ncbi:hypothetical protein B0H13DRAFT_1866147 [Mycena leptocephala]|nr:hypothetical protein B0H13DRAFT_1866147 [Mycena leptocephala]
MNATIGAAKEQEQGSGTQKYRKCHGEHTDQDLEGLDQDSLSSRRHLTTNSYTKIDRLLAALRRERISPLNIVIQVLDPDDIAYDRYHGNLYHKNGAKLSLLIEMIMSEPKGKQKLLECMQPHLADFTCDTVAEEMEVRRRKSILAGIEAVMPLFMETWNVDEQIDHTPFLTRILETAAQTDTRLKFNRDIRPSLDALNSLHEQLIIVAIHCLGKHNEDFSDITKHSALEHIPRRPIPFGYKTQQCPLHRDLEALIKYAIPGFHDQLTNARIRSAQRLRAKDGNAWEHQEIFQLGFGLFHLCLNLVWAILHVHRATRAITIARRGQIVVTWYTLLPAFYVEIDKSKHKYAIFAFPTNKGAPEHSGGHETLLSDFGARRLFSPASASRVQFEMESRSLFTLRTCPDFALGPLPLGVQPDCSCEVSLPQALGAGAGCGYCARWRQGERAPQGDARVREPYFEARSRSQNGTYVKVLMPEAAKLGLRVVVPLSAFFVWLLRSLEPPNPTRISDFSVYFEPTSEFHSCSFPPSHPNTLTKFQRHDLGCFSCAIGTTTAAFDLPF